mmetsp:Transcript_28264/g.71733  ORF Transcript_28264/g.71733 Transcript_28264/m.71733 type:complete len:283 (-) Transcript_28264:302-1150(-)
MDEFDELFVELVCSARAAPVVQLLVKVKTPVHEIVRNSPRDQEASRSGRLLLLQRVGRVDVLCLLLLPRHPRLRQGRQRLLRRVRRLFIPGLRRFRQRPEALGDGELPDFAVLGVEVRRVEQGEQGAVGVCESGRQPPRHPQGRQDALHRVPEIHRGNQVGVEHQQCVELRLLQELAHDLVHADLGPHGGAVPIHVRGGQVEPLLQILRCVLAAAIVEHVQRFLGHVLQQKLLTHVGEKSHVSYPIMRWNRNHQLQRLLDVLAAIGNIIHTAVLAGRCRKKW